jgi:hypothetical protein
VDAAHRNTLAYILALFYFTCSLAHSHIEPVIQSPTDCHWSTLSFRSVTHPPTHSSPSDVIHTFTLSTYSFILTLAHTLTYSDVRLLAYNSLIFERFGF